jgi:type IV pilus assembly protein PilB
MSDNNNQNTSLTTGIQSTQSQNSDAPEETSRQAEPTNVSTQTPTTVRGVTNILDALVTKGTLTTEQANSVRFQAINSGKTFQQVLKENNLVTEKEIARTYAEMRGLGFADLRSMVIMPEVFNNLSKEIASKNLAIVFEEQPTKVKVAMVDPLDLQKIKFLESMIGKRVESYYAAEEDINYILDTKYGAQITKEVTEALEEVGDHLIDVSKPEVSSNDLENAPIIRIVNMVLEYGIKNKASDIHIEPRENRVVVRFRVRGILSERLTIPKKLHSAVVTRIKILSNLKIDEHRIPQDGRFPVRNGSDLIDIRVSIIPGVNGEKIVMRLLEKSYGILNLEDTGIRGINLERMQKALKKTQGIILVTGPTGSGKTQTLASCLKILNTSEVNIVTLEDPVEIQIEGVNQVQVNPEVGLTFATGLRSFLRQDPDIIMVGEVRDSETANLATQAALVGRLVLSTVHTNSAAGAFPRLIDMGVEPFLIASTVNLVIGQRLIRVLCECKEQYEANEEVMKELHEILDPLNGVTLYDESNNSKVHFGPETQNVTLFKPVGCPKCNDTGYIRRTGIFEALEMTEEIGKIVMKKSSIGEIFRAAVEGGMITMVQDGYLKVLEGITSLEEVMRVRNE